MCVSFTSFYLVPPIAAVDWSSESSPVILMDLDFLV
jgi:hypothetical protein